MIWVRQICGKVCDARVVAHRTGREILLRSHVEVLPDLNASAAVTHVAGLDYEARAKVALNAELPPLHVRHYRVLIEERDALADER